MPRTGLTNEEIKEKALDATVEKMREVGFEKVRLTEIARELKISHAALYSHFKDKSALLDGVSERWLVKIDEKLDAIVEKKKDPCEKIHLWATAIHQAKLEKVKNDPELYKSFDMAAEERKPFVKTHLENMNRQLTALVKEAASKKQLRNADIPAMVKVIYHSCAAFNHPHLVAQHVNEKREPIMHDVIDAVLRGLKLK